MVHIYTMPKYLKNEKGIYEFICILYSTFKNLKNETIRLDCSSTMEINPTLMAPLGLILTKLKNEKNNIFFVNMQPNFKNILLKYSFLNTENYNNSDILQNYIKYESFNGDDNNSFRSYLYEQLAEIKNNEIISALLTHIMEVFINVKMHARTTEFESRYKNKEIFSSGYYDRNEAYVSFSIANNGQSFMSNIQKALCLNLPNEVDYIKWALIKKNSTKKARPGGLGLAMLKTLVEISKGYLIILSSKGYYEFSYNKNEFNEKSYDLSTTFPGTVITVNIPISSIPIIKTLPQRINFSLEDLLMEDI